MNLRDQVAIIQRERTQQFVRPYFPTPPSLAQIIITSTNNKALAYGSLKGLYFDTTMTPLSPSAPLATAYNPAAQVAITDKGIAYGALYLNGTTTNVLVVNRTINDASGSAISTPVLAFDMPNLFAVLCYRQVAVPAPAGAYVTAYEAYWA